MGRRLPRSSPQLTALSDEDVVDRVRAGETELFEILMRRYNQRLYRVARGFVKDDDEAEDITQEAYVKAFRALDRFRGEARFSTWLTKIAAHEAMVRARRMRLVSPEDELADAPSSAPDPERQAENHELLFLLREAVDALPDALRPVFVLREVEGLSSEEAAAALGMSAGNVRVRLHRAKVHLRERLRDRMGADPRQLYHFDGARCDRLVETVFTRLAGG
ncbi:MAG: RNA polymerase sigma factor [Candidatus Eiseniibacteriota bacterium]